MEAPKDKRTKEYKEWKAKHEVNQNKKGVGDVIETITEATGIKAVVKAIAGDNCGCEERKESINKLFGKRKVLCLEPNEYDYLKNVFESKGKIEAATQIRMKAIFERVFQVKITSSCLSCSFINEVYKPLKRLYNAQ